MTDAFHDAELCDTALDAAFSGTRPYDEAMADYQRKRDARVLPLYEFTNQMGDLDQPPPPELMHLIDAIAGNDAAMNEFVSVLAGTISPAEFFHPAHVETLLGAPA